MPDPTPPPISVQLYSLRDEIAADFPAVLARLGAKGYPGVELAGFGELTPAQLADALTRAGLVLSSAHVGYARPDEFAAALDDHQSLGCDTAIVPAIRAEGFADLDAVHKTAERINRLVDVTRAHEMTLGYHNHWWELTRMPDDRPALLHLFEQLAPDVVAEVDVYWAQVGGCDPAEVVAALGSRAAFLHVKDGPADEPPSPMVAVGDGAVDIPGVLAAAPAARWHVVELDRCATDMFDAVERSYDYLVGGGHSSGRVSGTRVAIVGCGVISGTYAHTISQFDFMELAACVDADSERAEKLAAKFGATARPLADVLADPEIDAIVNLTPPLAHEAVSRAALEAGKATFSEKPLGVELAEGQALVGLASAGNVALGCAPDTFLGVGLQTARAAIDRGDIGEPLAANAFMLGSGPESWHPSPAIFYQHGAGPLLDMGPYYLTTLVQLLGPARSITASARISRAQRPILSEPMRGQLIDVEVPTHVGSLVEFASGSIASLVTSFDVQATRYFNIEIYGTEATMSVPNPNTFDGPVRIKRNGDEAWTDVDLLPAHLPQQRGIGLADMVWAQRTGRPHRASGALALHVLELMTGALTAAETGRRVELATTCDRAAPLPTGLAPNTFDD